MQIVQEIESKALSFDDLKRMLRDNEKDTQFYQYNELSRFQSIDDLFGQKNCAIILLSIEGPNAPKVGHWITLLRTQGQIEHFDSYGLNPDQELALTHEQPFLSKLLKNMQQKLLTNTQKLQQFREAVNTCGRWAVSRVLLKKFNQKQYINIINTAHGTPDVVITLMTMFL
jgi:hypothetical protein